MKQNKKSTTILGVFTILMMVTSIYAVFRIAPTERIMGDVQRIFYFHATIAIESLLAAFLVFIASAMYLWQKDPMWDRLAASAAEIVILFSSLVLITGMLWARPIWNAWWTWDPRLVSTLILWFIYVAYFMVRASVPDAGKRARFSAIIGIVGFVDVPIIRISAKWRSMHPLLSEEGGGLNPLMRNIWLFVIVSFTFLLIWFLWYRVNLAKLEDEVQRLNAKIEEKE
ncbi:MAG: cytochrome c biogenesis protein [Thermodesulfobacteriota bacterium]